MLWSFLQERLNETDGNPATVWFVWEDKEKKRGKEKLHSLRCYKEVRIHRRKWSCQKPQKQASKHCPRRNCIPPRLMGRLFVRHFLKLQWRGDVSRNCFYLYIHSILFQSMMNRWTSLEKGGVDLFLLSFYLPAPHTTPLHSRPTTWLNLPRPPVCFGQSLRTVPREGITPACRYCSYFHLSIMSFVADVHMCCPCVYPVRWTSIRFCYLSFSSFFRLGWALKSEQGHLFKRGRPTLYLLFDLLYPY